MTTAQCITPGWRMTAPTSYPATPWRVQSKMLRDTQRDHRMHIPTWLPHLIDTWGYLAVALAIGIESMGIPFPGETTLVLAAVYTGSSHNGHLNVVGVI